MQIQIYHCRNQDTKLYNQKSPEFCTEIMDLFYSLSLNKYRFKQAQNEVYCVHHKNAKYRPGIHSSGCRSAVLAEEVSKLLRYAVWKKMGIQYGRSGLKIKSQNMN